MKADLHKIFYSKGETIKRDLFIFQINFIVTWALLIQNPIWNRQKYTEGKDTGEQKGKIWKKPVCLCG